MHGSFDGLGLAQQLGGQPANQRGRQVRPLSVGEKLSCTGENPIYAKVWEAPQNGRG